MSKNKGFSETSAGRYSLALYELAVETKMLSEIEAHSVSIIDLIASSEDFNSLIKNPTNDKDDQLNALRKISDQYKLNELLRYAAVKTMLTNVNNIANGAALPLL